MVATHTPWKHETNPAEFHFGAIVDAMGNSICSLHGYDKQELGLVLAAAPDMLEACRLAWAFLDHPDGGTDSQYREAKDAVERALAKVDGR